jgi:cytochrome c-type biogenesis protein CcmE
VARRTSPARLAVAVGLATVLAVFLVYTALAGRGIPSLEPSTLHGRTGHVNLTGKVQPGFRETASGVRFALSDIDGRGRVLVSYSGTVPDQFKVGRHVSVDGRLRDGVFVATSIVTKCPSKYSPKKS